MPRWQFIWNCSYSDSSCDLWLYIERQSPRRPCDNILSVADPVAGWGGGAVEKHEIYVTAFNGHLFYYLFSQGVGGTWSLVPPLGSATDFFWKYGKMCFCASHEVGALCRKPFTMMPRFFLVADPGLFRRLSFADPRGHQGRAPPLRPIYFIFMHFLGKNWPGNSFPCPSGKSWIRHCVAC